MQCTCSEWMYEKTFANPSGKRSLTRNPRYGIPGTGHMVSSGKCIACKTHGTGDWSTRLILESMAYPFSTAATFTLNEANAVEFIEELPRLFDVMKKRFRRRGLDPRMHVFCEYGGQFGRAHAHANIFNVDWRKFGFQRLEGRFYTSELLQETLWDHRGYVYLDDISPASNSYIAGHNVGKLGVPRLRPDGRRNYLNIPAKNPAIGYDRVLQFKSDFIAVNGVVVNGSVRRFPAAFKKYYPDEFESIIEHDREYAVARAAALDHEFFSTGNLERIEMHNMRLISSVQEMVAWHGASHAKREPVPKSTRFQQSKDRRNMRDLVK